ncbi:MAG: TonB-dependent receptor [Acidimicrobiia bacterium]|nr:TonB-dependent receptor [Acidimicrobiia bacterium]
MARMVCRILVVGAILAMPLMAFAQEATITGTVTDSTGAVLPGVTVVAVNEATGNRFETVTDERGLFRIAARVGAYRLSSELQGFTTVTRTGVQLLVGQSVNVSLQMSPSTVQETVTVTADAPLLNVTTSSLGGNVDPQQVQELPVAGRNWMGLALLAPGSRTSSTNATAPLPDRNGGEAREFQLNLDGQQISSELGAGGQPRFSQDSIAEFQFISNRFDATQGRSTGVQVNAISKSGTNRLAGLFRANFRDTSFNAENPVLNRVVPISNQQYSTTLGGPLVQDKLHYFGNFEYEREPRSSIWNTPYPAFNIELKGKISRRIAGIRFDYQLSQNTRLMGKVSGQNSYEPFGAGSATAHPASTIDVDERNREYLASFTQVIGNRTLNEIRAGYSHFGFANATLVNWSRHWQAPNGITNGYPRITFTGFTFNANANAPRHRDQKVWQIRDDFSHAYDFRGRHDMRAGFEFVDHYEDSLNCNQCGGTIDARGTFQGAVIPSAAQLQAWFPDPFNADTWNFAAITPWVRTYTIGIGQFPNQYHQPKYGAWAQDDWRIMNNLTLNLGVRYDLSLNSWANERGLDYKPGQPPFFAAGRPDDRNNLQPRLGFAYQWNDRTVIRGGSGTYFADALTVDAFWPYYNTQLLRIQYGNDGRAAFAADPLNGAPLPSYTQAQALLCNNPSQAANFASWQARGFAGAAPCILNALQEMPAPDEYMKQARSWNSSIGFQRQIGGTMAIEVDYIHTKGAWEKDTLDNVNLAYNAATGANVPYAATGAGRANLPWPDMGIVSMIPHDAASELRSVQTAFTKRMSQRWQASATYTLSWFYNRLNQPFSGLTKVPFAVQPDLGNEWGLSADDQRHRAVFNGIWAVGRGFQVSGLHFFAAGLRSASSYGGDLRGIGGGGEARLRPNGTIVPRNAFIQPAQNKTDIRVQQRIPLGRVSVDVIAEVFNAFNRPNWGVNTQESNVNFNQRITAQFRTAQVGFRVTF